MQLDIWEYQYNQGQPSAWRYEWGSFYWSVIERKPGSAKLHNRFNSTDKFNLSLLG